MRDERHRHTVLTVLKIVAGAVPVEIATLASLRLFILDDGVVGASAARFASEFIQQGVLGVVVLLGCGAGFYVEDDHAQAYRALAAAIFTGMAAFAFNTDPELNVQNVLIGLAALISIAAIVVPPLHRHAPKSDSPEATPRAGHA